MGFDFHLHASAWWSEINPDSNATSRCLHSHCMADLVCSCGSIFRLVIFWESHETDLMNPWATTCKTHGDIHSQRDLFMFLDLRWHRAKMVAAWIKPPGQSSPAWDFSGEPSVNQSPGRQAMLGMTSRSMIHALPILLIIWTLFIRIVFGDVNGPISLQPCTSWDYWVFSCADLVWR